ncbi:unnamed protein product [Paramecium pentaurelia]|uniref:Protein kinase domain-containing protein n=1 Tax=Paramecium pentaurelia TaxID=43138 RepID=A0A8S1TJN9_9CILI|nr:unnamed protein product [Paramecium pentaurelia]
MRQKSDSCFSSHTNRLDTLWKKGYPQIQYGSQLVTLNGVKIKDGQKNILQFKFAYLQNKYLVVDQKFVNLENIQMKKVILQQNQQQSMAFLKFNNNFDSFEIIGSVHLVNEIYNYCKLYTIQDNFENYYQIMQLMGRGSFAKVFKIKQIENQKIYAVKIFNKMKMKENEEENQKSLWKEVHIMRQMNHKHIIKLREVYEDNYKVYVVIDLLNGGDLISHIEKQIKVYDESLVRKLVYNLLDALVYIHERKIIHRDIKPENLILKEENDISNIVLADFGLADYYQKDAQYLFKRCGSLGYVAPEILQDKHYDFKVDIYSLGIVMFLLLTGEQAFKGSSTQEVLQNNTYGKIDDYKLESCHVSQDAKNLCRQMLNINSNQRLTAEAAIKHPWFKVDNNNISLHAISINRIPQNLKGQKEFLFSNTPLWVNKSLRSIGDSSENLAAITINVRDKTIQEILDNHNFKLDSTVYDLEDDYVDEQESISIRIENHKLLVKQRSLP